MRKLFYTLILCCISFLAHPVYFKHLGMKEGLSQLSVMSIYQDEFGRMWFGTEEGLCVYNGNRVISYKPSEFITEKDHTNAGLLGNANFPITGDGKGSLFFRSDNNSLLRFDLRLERFEKLISNDVYAVSFTNNQIFIGVNDSLMIWNNTKMQAEHLVTLESERIQNILVDKSGDTWIGTLKGLYHLSKTREVNLVIPEEDIYTLYEDSKRNLWVGTRENGMYRLDFERNIRKYMHKEGDMNSLSSNHVRGFTEDNLGNILIGTFLGLNVYNSEKNTFSVYSKNHLPGKLLHSSVFSVYKDKQGTIWLGTYYGGVYYFNPEMDIFTYYSADPKRSDCLSDPFVGRMVEDHDHNVWICTEGGGLNFFNRKTKQLTHYLSEQGTNAISHNNLKGICFSSVRKKLYIATHTGGLSIFDLKSKKFKNIRFIKDKKGLSGSAVINHQELFEDRYLIMLTPAGIFKMSLETEEITTLFDDGIIHQASAFHIDSKNNIWLIQGGLITRINLLNPQNISQYNRDDYKLGRFPIISVFEDKQGRIFFGTRGSGLYMLYPEQGHFAHFSSEQNLLQSNYCYAIAQSNEGYLIIIGDKGLSLLDPDKRILRSVELETALPLSGINYGCGILVCKNGEVFIGGVNGLATFFEESLHLPPKDYQLYFSSLSVNNEEIAPNSSENIISEALPYIKEIKLDHYQNNLIFSFASNNYIEAITGTKREYKLSGFDEKWIMCNGNNISYTNLNPGKYVLQIRDIHPEIYQITNVINMNIEIKAPLYATTGAYIFYIFLILGILYITFRVKKSRLVLSTSLEFERKEKIRIEELNKEKLQFFSNISHEFRTPLTLIISQLELLIQSQKLAPLVYNRLLKVYKHSFHMRTLITELLDFRKLEQGHSKLHIAESDLVAFVREIYFSFTELATKEKITYHFSSSSESISCWFDQRQMQKVISNLLVNAFKFTKQQGNIDLSIEEAEDMIILKIIDDGVGIEKNELHKVFDRFYQGNNQSSSEKTSPGSGLGLALVKTIIELHHGEVTVESKPGYGSIFVVKLLKGNDHFSNDNLSTEVINLNETSSQAQTFNESDVQQEKDSLPISVSEEKYSILIIEDNKELLELLVSLFSPFCKVTQATNGREGLIMAHKEMPDIILSDIMMPEMSGTEMCSRIKSDIEICHIPIVLLTALNSPEQNIEGLSRGAEAYISKPFDSRVLVARCSSIIRNRAILRKKFVMQENLDSVELTTNPIDQKFLDTVQKLVCENLTNEAFDINEMAKEVGLSRSSFYAKFKTLTGMTPNDFVLDYKLKQAATMLKKNPEMQIMEIASATGFGSSRYFSRCFKTRYGSSPAEYRTNKS